ncbi:HeH/LEM domain-containing protein [Enterococcus cecorum]|uniref:HeH/LEM domain-containing protein n=1 Tax=Enterococcus cecorum TaxID=44008 RepID=UPI0032C43286
MRYKDIKTGAIIVTDSVLGGDWVVDDGVVDNTKTESSEIEKEPDVAEEVVEEDEKLDESTVAELKARLDEMGVTYPTSARKQDLIDILSQF